MASRSNSGTAKGIAVWYRQQRWGAAESTIVELHAMQLEGPQLVASWSLAEMRQGVEAWTNEVDLCATTDAEGRDTTTSYELRHVDVDGRIKGTTHLRRVRTESSDDTKLEARGTAESLIIQLQKSLERANAQVIESARVATMTATAAVEAQKAALVMLSQSYQLIGAMQTKQVEMHADIVEPTPAAAPKPGDEAFKQVMTLVAPKIVEHVLKQLADQTTTTEN